MKDDRFYDALAHPTRRAVLALLRTGEAFTAGDIAEQLAMNKPTLSGHLNILKNAGLVSAHRSGIRVFYRIDAERIRREITALCDLVGTAPDGGGRHEWAPAAAVTRMDGGRR